MDLRQSISFGLRFRIEHFDDSDEIGRIDLPGGISEWTILKNGRRLLHRIGGPAFVGPNGEFEWVINGVRHRLDGPAKRDSDGIEYWFFDGKLHRDSGPAIVFPNGTQIWYEHGARHREDGPAVENTDGTYEYWINSLICRDAEDHQETLKLWRIRQVLEP